MKEEKNIMNAAELNEEELEKVGGGSKKLNRQEADPRPERDPQ